MRSKFSKYKFSYSPSDYQYNLRYKWMSKHQRPYSVDNSTYHDNLYFIEMLNNPDQTNQQKKSFPIQVQQLSPELCAKIDQAWLEGQSRVYIRTSGVHGHYINLDNMTLVNTCTMSKRRIHSLKSLPQGAIIYHPLTQTSMRIKDSPSPIRQLGSFPLDRDVNIESFSPQHKLRYQNQLMTSKLQQLGMQEIQEAKHQQSVHWMECIDGHNLKYKPLKRSLSDVIERNYLLYTQQICNSISEILWQDKRLILDLQQNTLQYTQTLQVNRISRVNLKDVHNIQKLLQYGTDRESAEVSQKSKMNTCEWQYELCQFKGRGIQWENYDQKTQNRLEKKFQEWIKLGDKKHKNNFQVKRGSQAFYIDYEKMIEYNTIYRTQRQIRRIDPNESII